MSMVPKDYRFSDLLLQLVQEGSVPVRRIDEAVRRILTLKYQLGLFSDPQRGIDSNVTLGSPESRQASLAAARESITLLKNENRTLPLAILHILLALFSSLQLFSPPLCLCVFVFNIFCGGRSKFAY